LAIVALALDADVPRNALARWHAGPKNEFHTTVRA
jgi:hypothetical protein